MVAFEQKNKSKNRCAYILKQQQNLAFSLSSEQAPFFVAGRIEVKRVFVLEILCVLPFGQKTNSGFFLIHITYLNNKCSIF